MSSTTTAHGLMTINSDPDQLFKKLRKKFYNATRVHPGINRFLAALNLDIKVYKVNSVRSGCHYTVRYPYLTEYQYYTSDYPDHAVDRAIELAIRHSEQ